MSTASVVDDGAEIRCMACNKSGWCVHIKLYIENQEDTGVMHPDMHVFVPLFPTWDLNTMISLSEEQYPGAALMEIDHQPDFGNARRVALGFWNVGEGRLSIRRVIVDWLKSKYPYGRADLNCTSGTHKFQQVNELGRMLNDGRKDALWPNAWAIQMEGACVPCIRLSADPDDVPDPGNAAPWRNQ